MAPTFFFCPICEQDVLERELLTHTPQCYRLYCLNKRILPLCTCNTCKGSKTHDGDSIDAFLETLQCLTPSHSQKVTPIPNLSPSNNTSIPTNNNNNNNAHTPQPQSQSQSQSQATTPPIINTTPSFTSSSSSSSNTITINSPPRSTEQLFPDLSPTNHFSTKTSRNSTPIQRTGDNNNNNNRKNNNNNNNNNNGKVSTPTLNQPNSTSRRKPLSKSSLTCICCEKRQAPSQVRLPLIVINGFAKGKYCVCKKKHIFDKEEYDKGLLRLENLYCESITSENEDGQLKELDKRCAGFKTDSNVCDIQCGALLSCKTETGEKTYFCTPLHLMSFIQTHYPFKKMGKRKKSLANPSNSVSSPALLSSDEDSDSGYSFLDSPARKEKDLDDDEDDGDYNNNNNNSKYKQTAYSLFCDDNRKIVQEEHPNFSTQEVNQHLSVMWRSVISDQEKRSYIKSAEASS